MADSNILMSKMRIAGVPRDVLSTTLTKEKHDDLRQYVMRDIHADKSILVIQGEDTEVPFYLVAKELILTNRRVVCMRLVDIATALFKDGDEAEELSAKLEEAECIAIDAFVDKGGRSSQFLSDYELAYFVSWFIRNHQNGKSFILRSTVPLDTAQDWWSASFLGYIGKRAVLFFKGKK